MTPHENEYSNACLQSMITGEKPKIPFSFVGTLQNPYDFLVEHQITICIQDLKKIVEDKKYNDVFEIGDFLFSQIFPFCSFSDSEIAIQKEIFFLRIAEVYNYFRSKKITFLEHIDILDEGESYAFSLDQDNRVILFLFLNYRWIIGSLTMESYSHFRHDAKIIGISSLNFFLLHEERIKFFSEKIKNFLLSLSQDDKKNLKKQLYFKRIIYALGKIKIGDSDSYNFSTFHFFEKVLSSICPHVFFKKTFTILQDGTKAFCFHPHESTPYDYYFHFLSPKSENDKWSVIISNSII